MGFKVNLSEMKRCASFTQLAVVIRGEESQTISTGTFGSDGITRWCPLKSCSPLHRGETYCIMFKGEIQYKVNMKTDINLGAKWREKADAYVCFSE